MCKQWLQKIGNGVFQIEICFLAPNCFFFHFFFDETCFFVQTVYQIILYGTKLFRGLLQLNSARVALKLSLASAFYSIFSFLGAKNKKCEGKKKLRVFAKTAFPYRECLLVRSVTSLKKSVKKTWWLELRGQPHIT